MNRKHDTIYKFPLRVTPVQTVEVPAGAKFLSLQLQGGRPTMWCQVNSLAPPCAVHICMVGTGRALQDGFEHYLGTVHDDLFVWHYYAATGRME